ncbi:MAG: glyoxalase superfamily protein [Bacteroidota bacterium]
MIEFKAVPTFRILDYKTAITFYVDFLGFSIDWEHRFEPSDPVYMQISNDGLMLHLSENERFKTGNISFVESKGIQAFRDKIISRNPENSLSEIQKTDWGTIQLEIEDPFGNLLRFNEKSNS